MRLLHLLRHGATDASRRHLYYGASDIPLAGDAGAELEALKQEGIYPDAAGCRVITTGLKRTEETLAVLYPGLVSEKLLELREMNFGAFELRGYEELKEDPDYQIWISGDYQANICPGGESANEHAERCRKAIDRLLQESGQDLLIVCHGGSIACVMQHLFPGEGENRWYWDCKTGRGFTVTLDGSCPVGWKRI